jgi:hypothetical protein
MTEQQQIMCSFAHDDLIGARDPFLELCPSSSQFPCISTADGNLIIVPGLREHLFLELKIIGDCVSLA